MSEMYLSHAIRTRNKRDSPGVYIVRDGDLALYVGKAKRPRQRLWHHVHASFAGFPIPSEFGRLVIANEPESMRWRVEIIDAEYDVLEQLERRMIAEHRPCLNRRDNPNGQLLPKAYQRLTKWEFEEELRQQIQLREKIQRRKT